MLALAWPCLCVALEIPPATSHVHCFTSKRGNITIFFLKRFQLALTRKHRKGSSHYVFYWDPLPKKGQGAITIRKHHSNPRVLSPVPGRFDVPPRHPPPLAWRLATIINLREHIVTSWCYCTRSRLRCKQSV
jgi:hypothetical protein